MIHYQNNVDPLPKKQFFYDLVIRIQYYYKNYSHFDQKKIYSHHLILLLKNPNECLNRLKHYHLLKNILFKISSVALLQQKKIISSVAIIK